MTSSKTGQTYSVFSSTVFSAFDLSETLRSLKVTHTIDSPTKGVKARRVNMKQPQPRDVHICYTLKGLRPRAINFIVGSHGMLSMTNVPALSGPDLVTALMTALLSEAETRIEVSHMSPVDYINHVAKPSLLNKILTAVQHVSPYTFRKEVQAMIVDYFNSRCSERTLLRFLARNMKLEAKLTPIIKDGHELRRAVQLLKEGGDPEVVSMQTGVPAFDMQYFLNAGKPKVKKVEK